jgi:hypothetical protein
MTIATINRYIQHFSDALAALGADVPMHEVERLAMIVHGSMENAHRVYHTSRHVFALCEGMNSRQVLAALFHDVVYYQLDGGFPLQAADLLEQVVHRTDGGLELAPINPGDSLLRSCAEIFGFTPGQVLPLFGGLNEFLSAVVTIRLLQPYLPASDLIAIVACIEATVPFRGPDAAGCDPMSALAERVRNQYRELPHLTSDAQLDQHVAQAMHDAVQIANRDVAGFAQSKPGRFLSDTWQLIEESNAPLAAVGVYTLRDYRNALLRMEKFLGSLKAESIFHRHAHSPNDAEFAALVAAAEKNLSFAQHYLGAKLASIAIIEALAIATGGDCPVSMFLGDIRSPDGRPDRVEDFLPPPGTHADIDLDILEVLEQGREREPNSDLSASPLTAYLYCRLGHHGTFSALEQAKRMFSGQLPELDFLRGIERETVGAIIAACMRIATSRREALRGLQHELMAHGEYPRQRH